MRGKKRPIPAYNAYPGSQADSGLVAARKQIRVRKVLCLFTVRPCYYRRQLIRLGSNMRFPYSPRSVGLTFSVPAFQHQRNGGGMARMSSVSNKLAGKTRPCSNGQQVCSDLSQQTRHKKQRPYAGGRKDLDVGRGQSARNQSFLHCREGEPSRRQPEQATVSSWGMATQFRDISEPGGPMGHAPSGLNGNLYQQTSASLLCTASGPSCSTSGCTGLPLGLSDGLYFSSNSTHPQSIAKDKQRVSDSNSNLVLLAQEAVVLSGLKNVNSDSVETATGPKASDSGTRLPSVSCLAKPDGLGTEVNTQTSSGFADKVVSTLLKSRKDNTRKAYYKIWSKYVYWCQQHRADHSLVASVLDFLQAGLDLGLALNTLKMQISALGALLDIDLAANRYIARFVQAVSRVRPFFFGNP